MRAACEVTGCGKNLSESFDELRTNGGDFEMIEKIPFMLRFSKHETPFFRSLVIRQLLPDPLC